MANSRLIRREFFRFPGLTRHIRLTEPRSKGILIGNLGREEIDTRMSPRRMVAVVRKEMLHIVRDPRNLFLVTISPGFLLLLLAYIFSFDLGHVNLAVLDLDRTSFSRNYIANLTSDPDLNLTTSVERYDAILPLLVSGQVDAGLVIPPGFADTAYAGRPAEVQAVLDGSDPIASRQAMSVLEARSAIFVTDTRVKGAALSGGLPVVVRSQAWYNAGMKSLLSMVPGLLAVVLVMPALALVLALTREKESGTLEGLISTPISGLEYLLGKLFAYVLMGLVSTLLAILVAVLWFEVPFRGSLPVFLLLTADYFLASMGFIVMIANFVTSQQTAMFIVLLIFIVPSFFLAGLITPISNQSLGAMLTSNAMPSTHFVEISRVVFLKGLGLEYVARPALILLGMGLGSLIIGLAAFRKKVS